MASSNEETEIVRLGRWAEGRQTGREIGKEKEIEREREQCEENQRKRGSGCVCEGGLGRGREGEREREREMLASMGIDRQSDGEKELKGKDGPDFWMQA